MFLCGKEIVPITSNQSPFISHDMAMQLGYVLDQGLDMLTHLKRLLTSMIRTMGKAQSQQEDEEVGMFHYSEEDDLLDSEIFEWEIFRLNNLGLFASEEEMRIEYEWLRVGGRP